MKADLQDVIEAIEYENPMFKHYYNKQSGIIIYKEDESSAKYTKWYVNLFYIQYT